MVSRLNFRLKANFSSKRADYSEKTMMASKIRMMCLHGCSHYIYNCPKLPTSNENLYKIIFYSKIKFILIKKLKIIPNRVAKPLLTTKLVFSFIFPFSLDFERPLNSDISFSGLTTEIGCQ